MPSLEEDISYIEWQMDVNLMRDSKVRFRRVIETLRGSSEAEQRGHSPQVVGSIPTPATNNQEHA